MKYTSKFILCILILFLVFSFNSVNAETISVNTFDEFVSAIGAGATEIEIKDNFSFNSKVTLINDLKINGNNYTISRDKSYLKEFIIIPENIKLEINNLKVDGLASGWKIDFDNGTWQKENNKGLFYVPVTYGTEDVVATTTIFSNSGDLLFDGVTVENVISTANGGVINGSGNNIINNSTIKRCFNTVGGALYVTCGLTKISSSVFKELGAGLEKKSARGPAIYISNAKLEISDNSLFEDNYSSTGAGAIYSISTSLNIKDTTFKHNMTGNDGSVMIIESSTAATKVTFDNVIFDSNHGLANTGQSLGTIYISKASVDKTDPSTYMEFKNCVFKNNIVAAGGATADISSKGNLIIFDNCEIYDNDTNGAAAFYIQSTDVIVKNSKIHDNYGGLYGTIRVAAYDTTKVIIDNVEFYNNETNANGSAVSITVGDVEIKNSKIYDNIAKTYGSIYVYGSKSPYNNKLKLENTIVTGNKAEAYGGGIYIEDLTGFNTTVDVDSNSKIYNNKADIAGDDFVYKREDTTTKNENISLDDAAIMGINGVNEWYNDEEDTRFLTTDNPTQYDLFDKINNTVYLKAAGISKINYDLNLGNSDYEYTPISIKYGEEITLPSDVPNKSNEKFKGWNTKADGTGVWLYSGDKYDGSEGFTLYAQYEVINPDTGDSIFKNFYLIIISLILLVVTCTCYLFSNKNISN